jgi:hypothetical protein
MLQSHARPAFLTACACHFALSVLSTPNVAPALGANPLVQMGGALAFVIAATLGIIVLLGDGGMHKAWTKAALVFLTLGPLAFWFLQWPAISGLLCFDCTIATDVQARAFGDIMQSQIAMIAVALAALFCAARAMSATLDELAI